MHSYHLFVCFPRILVKEPQTFKDFVIRGVGRRSFKYLRPWTKSTNGSFDSFNPLYNGERILNLDFVNEDVH